MFFRLSRSPPFFYMDQHGEQNEKLENYNKGVLVFSMVILQISERTVILLMVNKTNFIKFNNLYRSPTIGQFYLYFYKYKFIILILVEIFLRR